MRFALLLACLALVAGQQPPAGPEPAAAAPDAPAHARPHNGTALPSREQALRQQEQAGGAWVGPVLDSDSAADLAKADQAMADQARAAREYAEAGNGTHPAHHRAHGGNSTHKAGGGDGGSGGGAGAPSAPVAAAAPAPAAPAEGSRTSGGGPADVLSLLNPFALGGATPAEQASSPPAPAPEAAPAAAHAAAPKAASVPAAVTPKAAPAPAPPAGGARNGTWKVKGSGHGAAAHAAGAARPAAAAAVKAPAPGGAATAAATRVPGKNAVNAATRKAVADVSRSGDSTDADASALAEATGASKNAALPKHFANKTAATKAAAGGGRKPGARPAAFNSSSHRACEAPGLPKTIPQGVPIKALKAGQKPNFIVILTDDQGWDDVGLHNRQYVKTPNLDKFLQGATRFDNFYVTPMCSQTRAQLLTGRDYARTGTMLVNGGYDYLNRGEATIGNIMGAAGYATSHFGKWHNGRTLGYEPWHMGFQDSWFPELYIHMDNIMRHNGELVQTYGLMEQDLMDKILGWLDGRKGKEQPFLMYYAPNAIHQGFLRPGQGPKWRRPAPEPYLKKFEHFRSEKVSQSTIEVWAMLEYMDDVLGRLFDYMASSPLRDNTYVMVMSDNGAELFGGELPNLQKRMPSKMQGSKREVLEGGVRNYLAVQGPGVSAGVIDSTIVDVSDVTPTIVDLAGIPSNSGNHLPFTGTSFKNLLLAGDAKPEHAKRRTALATAAQADRTIYMLSPICWDPDSVPELGPDRRPIKPQKLLDYEKGSLTNLLYANLYNDEGAVGFERCIAARRKDLKWIGRTGKVYRFHGGSHVELPCNQVHGPEADAFAAEAAAGARRWWASLIAEPHSFQKPTFYLGFQGWTVTNLLPDGARERTPKHIRLMPNGATGFKQPGDRMCFGTKVETAGTYEVVILYTSNVAATFKMAVGTMDQIKSDSAPAMTATLPNKNEMGGLFFGSVKLQATGGSEVDTCLTLIKTPSPGTPVFSNLGDIRVTLVTKADGTKVHKEFSKGAASAGVAQAERGAWADAPSMQAQAAAAAEEHTASRAAALDTEPASAQRSTWASAPSEQQMATAAAAAQHAPPADAAGDGSASPTAAASGAAARPLGRMLIAEAAESVLSLPPAPAARSDLSLLPQATLAAAASGGARPEPVRTFLRPTERMAEVERQAVAAAAAAAPPPLAPGAGPAELWQAIRVAHNWPDGQGLLESPYSPYHAEMIGACQACQPEIE